MNSTSPQLDKFSAFLGRFLCSHELRGVLKQRERLW